MIKRWFQRFKLQKAQNKTTRISDQTFRTKMVAAGLITSPEEIQTSDQGFFYFPNPVGKGDYRALQYLFIPDSNLKQQYPKDHPIAQVNRAYNRSRPFFVDSVDCSQPEESYYGIHNDEDHKFVIDKSLLDHATKTLRLLGDKQVQFRQFYWNKKMHDLPSDVGNTLFLKNKAGVFVIGNDSGEPVKPVSVKRYWNLKQKYPQLQHQQICKILRKTR